MSLDKTNHENTNELESDNQKEKLMNWLKKIGIGGLIFFTVKGCISLYIILQLGKCAIE